MLLIASLAIHSQQSAFSYYLLDAGPLCHLAKQIHISYEAGPSFLAHRTEGQFNTFDKIFERHVLLPHGRGQVLGMHQRH